MSTETALGAELSAARLFARPYSYITVLQQSITTMTHPGISRFRFAILAILALCSASTLAAQERVRLHLEEGKSGAVWDIALSPDGNTLYSCGRDSTAKSWNLGTGECIRVFRTGKPTLVTALALDYTGSYLALGDMNGRLSLWNARSGVLYYEFEAHAQYITDVAIAPDGGTVITAGRDGSMKMWKLDDGSPRGEIAPTALWVQTIAISPDGALLASGGQNGHVRLWRLPSGQADTILTTHPRRVMALAFSPDGKLLFSSAADGSVKASDLKTRATLRSFTLEQGGAHSIDVDRSQELLLLGNMNGVMEIWDWKKRLRQRNLPQLSYGTMSARFDGKGQRVYSAHTDGAIRIWNMQDASVLLSLVGFSDGQWLSFTPDGYYDCSSAGDRYVTWRTQQDEFPLQRFRDVYHRPSIIEDVLRGGYKPGATLGTLTVPPTVRLLAPRKQQVFMFGSESAEVLIEAEAHDARRIEGVRIAVNGRLLNSDALDDYRILARSDTSLRIRARVPVLPGRNSIEVVSWNSSRVRSDADIAEIVVESAGARNPDLYVLTVGADRYAPHYPDLQFAAVDAQAIADEFSRQQGAMYTRVYANALTGANTGKDKILAALRGFTGMTSRDVLVLFFSGHGVRYRDKSGKSRYYFLPAGTTRANIATAGLAWDDFTAELSRLRVGRVILLLDACHSGDVSAGASNEKVAAAIAADAGIVFTSSSGNEYSYEDASWGHGAFTRALLDGLEGKADFTRDKVVDWSELQLYVSTEVRRMTRGSQNPMVPRLEQFSNFDFVRLR